MVVGLKNIAKLKILQACKVVSKKIEAENLSPIKN
jgi:hypothetical protein